MVIGTKQARSSIQWPPCPHWPPFAREHCALAHFVGVAAVCLLLVAGTYCTARADDDDLEAALRGAADANRTVILSVLNKAYAEEDGLLDLFVEGLRRGDGTQRLIRYVLLVAMDRPAFRRCRSLGGVRCYRLPPAATNGTDDLSSEQMYMSGGFIRMMWRRIRLLGDVLRHGYSFVFTDLDVIWLKNPFPSLNRTREEDLLISSDQFNGRPEDYLGNELNTGFFFVATSNRTVALFDKWHAARNQSAGMKEQDVLNQMKRRGAFGRLGVRARVLDTARFSGFCQDSRDDSPRRPAGGHRARQLLPDDAGQGRRS
ncbi:hypothetical protein ACQ4PT_040548 [Festuca glaucescens]